MSDVYPLQLRLSVMRESDSFGVKISKKVNICLLESLYSHSLICDHPECYHMHATTIFLLSMFLIL